MPHLGVARGYSGKSRYNIYRSAIIKAFQENGNKITIAELAASLRISFATVGGWKNKKFVNSQGQAAFQDLLKEGVLKILKGRPVRMTLDIFPEEKHEIPEQANTVGTLGKLIGDLTKLLDKLVEASVEEKIERVFSDGEKRIHEKLQRFRDGVMEEVEAKLSQESEVKQAGVVERLFGYKKSS